MQYSSRSNLRMPMSMKAKKTHCRPRAASPSPLRSIVEKSDTAARDTSVGNAAVSQRRSERAVRYFDISRANVTTTTDPPGRDTFVRVGTLDEVKRRRMTVVSGRHAPLLIACVGDRCVALDNRCPHLGFPLHRGSIEDGILTCHWHHARFDLASGGGFDLWADDLPTAAVEIRNGEVWVSTTLRYPDGDDHWKNRLLAGMEHNLGLVIAKAILGRRAQGAAAADLLRAAALFGAKRRESWGTGITVLAALGNLVANLPEDTAYLALYKGIQRVAADCEERAPRRACEPLAGESTSQTLARWLRHWSAVRHRDAAGRTLLTAITRGSAPAELAEMMLVAATDRVFADGGHTVDFINKAFELLDCIGWEHASCILPATVDVFVAARGAEESDAWRHPTDLVALCAAAAQEMPAAIAAGADRRGNWRAAPALAEMLLGDAPLAIVECLVAAVRDGAKLSDLGGALAYAAALRVARFGLANEHSDWDSAHHGFTHANALHQILVRLEAGGRPPTAEAVRGVLHGAMAVYLLRFLNVPPAKLPGEGDAALDDLPESASDLTSGLLEALDRHGAVDAAPRYVVRYLALGHDPEALVATLAAAVLREDAGFHVYQMLEAGVRQFRERGNCAEARYILVAVARFLGAHTPTERGELQTATVARKLVRGESLHESDA
jgi:nitrite reductase/ring-hydroxylating ferredoxin subunit